MKRGIYFLCACVMLLSGCAVFVGEGSPFYQERRLDRDTPSPVLISDDRAFYLC